MRSALLGMARNMLSVGVGKGSLKGGGRMSMSTSAATRAGRPIAATDRAITMRDSTASKDARGSCLQASRGCVVGGD